MSSDKHAQSTWDRFRAEGGWAALAVGLLVGTVGVDGLLAALTESPKLDVEGAALLFQVFLVTFPFAVGVTVFTAILISDVIKSGYHLLLAGAVCLVGGAALGAALGSSGTVDLDAAAREVHGSGPTALGNTILWFLSAYYQLYGWQYFAAAVVLGVFFGRWGAWLVNEKAST